MVKRTFFLFLVCLVILALYTGCGDTSEPTTPTLPTLNGTSQSGDTVPAEGFDALGGSWTVGGIYYKKYLIDIKDNDALTDLYDSTYLTFYEGGTFLYMNLFNARGQYIKQDNGSFILKSDTVFTYDFSEEGLVEKESETSDHKSYLVTLLDENTILWNDLDPMTGKAAADSNTLVFVRENTQSAYIKDHKTALKGSSDSAASEPSPSEPSADTTPAATERPSQGNVSSGKRNALKSAKNYLNVMPFSYSGLVEQLEYEGYSHAEATYAADNCGADWYEQAVKSAKKYLEIMSFSRSGLIEQLEFEGYTYEQAVYGVDKAY